MATQVAVVATLDDVRASLSSFSSGASRHPERVRNLLSTTTFWVHDAAAGQFGPSKFVGLKDVTFQQYEAALVDLPRGFDGHRTWRAISRAVGDAFRPSRDLTAQLQRWADRLLGAGAVEGIDTGKWKFLSIAEEPAVRRTTNPDWTRDELIIALDLYMRLGRRVADDSHPDVIAVSDLLNSLPIHDDRPDAGRFRNPKRQRQQHQDRELGRAARHLASVAVPRRRPDLAQRVLNVIGLGVGRLSCPMVESAPPLPHPGSNSMREAYDLPIRPLVRGRRGVARHDP
jgi:hypothetical protein